MEKRPEKVVEVMVHGELVLIHGTSGDWHWRGGNWTSHIGSYGPFRSKAEATESARQTLESEQKGR